MEEIGRTLQKSGRRALTPLVRKLWREKNGELISKYAYLLDFFEDEGWVEQLVQIALKRRDLGDEGKSALLAALQNTGIDITVPPFTAILDGLGGIFRERLPLLLEKGEEGALAFLDEFVYSSPEARRAMIRDLATVADPRVLSLFEILLRFDSQPTVKESLLALGRVRMPGAATLLQMFRHEGEPALVDAAERSLRRLRFLGIEPDRTSPDEEYFQFYRASATPLDGAGNRAVRISRWREDQRIDTLILMLNDVKGVRDAYGYTALTAEETDELSAETGEELNFVEVASDYALVLIRDALFRSKGAEFPLPPDYYLYLRMFRCDELKPAANVPTFAGYDLERLAVSAEMTADSAALLDDDCFDEWFLGDRRIYDVAEAWNRLEEEGEQDLAGEFELLIERCCSDIVVDSLHSITRRLFLTADFILQSGRSQSVVEKALATAIQLADWKLPLHLHPFIRRYVLESIQAAREALAEGYDIRRYPDDDEDFESWD